MHILVPVKRVVDHNVKVRAKSDGSGVDTAGAKMSINPFDEVALEQAIRLREQGQARKVTVVTCGAAASQDVLRTGLALGADSAILVDTADAAGTVGTALDPLGIAGLLAAVARREQATLVLCGKQAIDDDLGAVGPMLAALLDWPQALSVNRLALAGAVLELGCDGDQGMEQWRIPTPAVLGVDLRLCDARSITLPNMMKARKAAIAHLPASELGATAAAPCRVTRVAEPAARPAGVKVADAAALVAQLKQLPLFTVGG